MTTSLIKITVQSGQNQSNATENASAAPPTQSVILPFCQIQDGLTLGQANSFAVTPDNDVIILKTSENDQYIAVTLPYSCTLSPLTLEQNLSLEWLSDTGTSMRLSGKLWAVHDNQSTNSAAFQEAMPIISRIDPRAAFTRFMLDGMLFEGLLLPTLENGSPQIDTQFIDSVIAQTSNGKTFQIVLEAALKNKPLTPGAKLTAYVNGGQNKIDLEITQTKFAAPEIIDTVVAVDNITYPAQIQILNNESEYNPHQRPFEENYLVKNGDQLFQLTMPVDVELNANPDTVMNIRYFSAHTTGRSTNWNQFDATVVKKDAVSVDHEYILATLRLSCVDANGVAITPENTLYAAINNKIQTTGLFTVNDSFTKEDTQKRLRQLIKKIGNDVLDLSLIPLWQEKDKSIELTLSITLPAKDIDVVLLGADTNANDWLKTLSAEDRKTCSDFIKTKLPNPLSYSAFDKASQNIMKEAPKQTACVIANLECKICQDGKYRVFAKVTPQATDTIVTIFDPATQTETKLGLDDFGMEHDNIMSEKEAALAAKHFWQAVSDRYASQGQVLAIEENNQTLAFMPGPKLVRSELDHNQKSGDTKATRIVPVATPSSITLNAPVKPDATELAPRWSRIEDMFTDDQGQITTASLSQGLGLLSLWYTSKGYVIKNSNIQAVISGKNIAISLDLLKLSAAVELFVDPKAKTVKGSKKQTQCLANIKNEFYTQNRGDYLNLRALANAIVNVNNSFIYKAASPLVEYDHTAGTARVIVPLSSDRTFGLRRATVGAGVSNLEGVALQANVAGKTYRGYTYETTETFYPQIDVFGAGASVTTPRTESGSQYTFGAQAMVQESLSNVSLSIGKKIPVRDSYWSFIYGMGAEKFFGPGEIDYTNSDGQTSTVTLDGIESYYLKPFVGLAYDEANTHFKVTAGPRIGTEGYAFAGISANMTHRIDLDAKHRWHVDLYTGAGILLGQVPTVAQYLSVPVDLHGASMPYPAFVTWYALMGANLMYQLPKPLDSIEVGVGAKAGLVGPTWSIGAGVVIGIDFMGIKVMVGPALVNGVPVPFSASFN